MTILCPALSSPLRWRGPSVEDLPHPCSALAFPIAPILSPVLPHPISLRTTVFPQSVFRINVVDAIRVFTLDSLLSIFPPFSLNSVFRPSLPPLLQLGQPKARSSIAPQLEKHRTQSSRQRGQCHRDWSTHAPTGLPIQCLYLLPDGCPEAVVEFSRSGSSCRDHLTDSRHGGPPGREPWSRTKSEAEFAEGPYLSRVC